MTALAHRIDRIPLTGCPYPIEVRFPLRIIDIHSPYHQPRPVAGDRAAAATSLPPFGALPPSRTHHLIRDHGERE